MGGFLSSRIEAALEDSPFFKSAVTSSFAECAFGPAGVLHDFQLLGTLQLVYDQIREQFDPFRMRLHRLLFRPPTQLELDAALRSCRPLPPGRAVDAEQFYRLASAVFSRMAARQGFRSSCLVAGGGVGVSLARRRAEQLPGVGSLLLRAGPVMGPLGPVLGLVAAILL